MPINKNVFIAAAIISLGFLTKEVIDTQNNARKAAPNTQQTISAAAEKMQQMNDDPSKKAALFTLSGAEKNTDDVLANLSKQYINAILIQSNQYHEAYQKLGFSTLLSGKRLLKDKDMRESYSILNQAKTLSQAQITRFDEIQQGFKASVQNSNLSESDKLKLLAMVEPKMAQSKVKFTEKINLEINSIELFEKAIQILSHREKWSVEGDDPVFKTDADLKAYNSYMIAIQANGKRGKEIAQSSIDTIKQEVRELQTP